MFELEMITKEMYSRLTYLIKYLRNLSFTIGRHKNLFNVCWVELYNDIVPSKYDDNFIAFYR